MFVILVIDALPLNLLSIFWIWSLKMKGHPDNCLIIEGSGLSLYKTCNENKAVAIELLHQSQFRMEKISSACTYIHTLKTESHHDANFVVTGGAGSVTSDDKLASWQLLMFSMYWCSFSIVQYWSASCYCSFSIVCYWCANCFLCPIRMLWSCLIKTPPFSTTSLAVVERKFWNMKTSTGKIQ